MPCPSVCNSQWYLLCFMPLYCCFMSLFLSSPQHIYIPVFGSSCCSLSSPSLTSQGAMSESADGDGGAGGWHDDDWRSGYPGWHENDMGDHAAVDSGARGSQDELPSTSGTSTDYDDRDGRWYGQSWDSWSWRNWDEGTWTGSRPEHPHSWDLSEDLYDPDAQIRSRTTQQPWESWQDTETSDAPAHDAAHADPPQPAAAHDAPNDATLAVRPYRLFRCAAPGCRFRVHSQPEYGSWCCRKCDWWHNWHREASKHAPNKKKHGPRCEGILAEDGLPVQDPVIAPEPAPDED